MVNISSIDIGTNSTRLLIAEKKENCSLEPLIMEERMTQLGKGLKKQGNLSSEAIKRVSEALKEYMDIITSYQGGLPSVVATSAARQAANPDTFIKTVEAITDSSCKVISGEEEASLSFMGVMSDLHRSHKNVIIGDAGGGSTELIFVKDGSVLSKISLEIGSRRFTETFFQHDPVTDVEINDFIAHTETILKNGCPSSRTSQATCIMVGGTATTLAMMDIGSAVFNYEEVHLYELSLNSISGMVKTLSAKTVQERKEMVGLHPQRADVILAGALIIESILKHLSLSSCRISVRDLLFGALI